MSAPFKVGLVGLGSITGAHLGGYARYGVDVVAGLDVSPAAREAFARTHPHARTYDDLGDFLADEDVQVVDLATPHRRDMRFPLLERIAHAGKPVLIQKPLAATYAEAVEIADLLDVTGTRAMVNQNMCFAPGVLDAVRAVTHDRALGRPFLAFMRDWWCFDQNDTHWFGKDERWWTLGVSVHQLAVLHMMLGPPASVSAALGRDPAQPGVTHDGYGTLLLRYPDGASATVSSTGTYYGPSSQDPELWVQGPLGVLTAHNSRGYTLSLRVRKDDADAERHVSVPARGAWFNDAFGRVMRHFQDALVEGRRPWCGVHDNLYVMAAVEAAYRSSMTHETVRLQEVMRDRYDPSYGPGWNHGFSTWQPPAPQEEAPST
ncbi:Gfo/Idh/MocA family protein [Deinococcus pimensis]|uniref:Gfo/Idh/MocA family protein n=1 Tax=Deinococcus pimensis TaxID=309888 RepID=UPI000488AEF2|nr:Gfo/Idh/MocA family oxidoreductase [Deinococcus pimensis]